MNTYEYMMIDEYIRSIILINRRQMEIYIFLYVYTYIYTYIKHFFFNVLINNIHDGCGHNYIEYGILRNIRVILDATCMV
jgi:hypothetical protein